MKTLKQLRQNINEAYGTGALGGNDQFGSTVPHVDASVTLAGNEELRLRINGFIKRQLTREFATPDMAFNMLRAKLNVFGLDFKTDQTVKTLGEVSLPMTRHGGSFGTTPTHDLSKGFYNENGFEGNIPHVLKGNISIGNEGGFYIDAEIQTTDGDG